MTLATFSPDIMAIYTLPELAKGMVKDEPMLYGASVDFILANKTRYPLTGMITQALVDDFTWSATVCEHAQMGYHPVIDTKVVHLMPGQYPCIPGWHCDGVIRNDRNSQPNLDTLNQKVKHFIVTIDTEGNTPTEFVVEDLELDVDPDRVWGSVDESVNKLIDMQGVKTFEADNGVIYRFTRETLHRGAECKKRTTRYFFRLSFYHMPVRNEERKQVQVYTTPSTGW